MVKNLPASAGEVRDADSVLGRGRPLEEGVTTHFSILAWRMVYYGRKDWNMTEATEHARHLGECASDL